MTPDCLLQLRAAFFFLVAFLSLATRPGLPAEPVKANALLQQGHVDEAAAALNASLAAQPADARARQLLCRIYYAQEMADAAIHQCELAAAIDPASSDDQMWLARAYGMKASKANPIAALRLAKKVHTAFERAVELNPENVRALGDLGEYYVAAPAIVGGGLDKAQSLAGRMQSRFPAQAFRLSALIAEKNKDQAAAEANFKSAVTSGQTPEAYVDLGDFYRRLKQTDKMLEAIQAGIHADRDKDAVLVDAASILNAAHTSPDLVQNLLRTYLASAAKSDEAPAFKVHLQLGHLLAKSGDAAAARNEFEAALALASQYAPAQKAMQGS